MVNPDGALGGKGKGIDADLILALSDEAAGGGVEEEIAVVSGKKSRKECEQQHDQHEEAVETPEATARGVPASVGRWGMGMDDSSSIFTADVIGGIFGKRHANTFRSKRFDKG